MPMIRLRPALALAVLALVGSVASAAPTATPAASTTTPAVKKRVEFATFAMGCFWCGETQFEEQPGVVSVVSGYCGGTESNPTYDQVSAGATSHYESIQIRFDPAVTTYEKMLDLFWHGIDPTQGNGQFCDHGRQYLSAVFGHNARQLSLARESKAALEASGVLKQPIVTEIRPAGRFWPAEEYHQDFWKKDPMRYRSYREGCGRDRRLRELWGDKAAKPLVH
jgi:peptide-methionine (S)-S-oxide reductase